MSFEVNASIPVKDVLSSPVTTVFENDNVEHVAKLIAKRNIGSIIVIDHKRNPVGVITESDIVMRVVAKNSLPRNIKAKEIMSFPLRIINPNSDLKEAAKKMNKYGIRRLVVMDKGTMVGIISNRDVVEVIPPLIEILMEKAKITPDRPLIRQSTSAGYCNQCRQWSDTLMSVEGRYLCEECRIELEAE